MDEIDRKIVNLLQQALPLTSRPFAAIGAAVGIEEREVVERVKALKQSGYIRRIGAVFEPEQLNYVSTLCGVHVEEQILQAVVKTINKEENVTHNYEREGELNLWFTYTAAREQEIESFLSDLEKTFSLKIYRFPKKRVFKIKTFFPV
jgi:siroheme decarboxylase